MRIWTAPGRMKIFGWTLFREAFPGSSQRVKWPVEIKKAGLWRDKVVIERKRGCGISP
jgi:hypothetical protein